MKTATNPDSSSDSLWRIVEEALTLVSIAACMWFGLLG